MDGLNGKEVISDSPVRVVYIIRADFDLGGAAGAGGGVFVYVFGYMGGDVLWDGEGGGGRTEVDASS